MSNHTTLSLFIQDVISLIYRVSHLKCNILQHFSEEYAQVTTHTQRRMLGTNIVSSLAIISINELFLIEQTLNCVSFELVMASHATQSNTKIMPLKFDMSFM